MERRSSWVGATGPTSTPWSTADVASGDTDSACSTLLSGPILVGGIRPMRPEVSFMTRLP